MREERYYSSYLKQNLSINHIYIHKQSNAFPINQINQASQIYQAFAFMNHQVLNQALLEMHQNENSNSVFSTRDFQPLLKRQATEKKQTQPININEQQLFSSINHQIVDQLYIVSSKEVKWADLRKELIVYYFERRAKINTQFTLESYFLHSKESVEDLHLISAMQDLLKTFKKNYECKFHLILPQAFIYFVNFSDRVPADTAVIISQTMDFGKILSNQGIAFERVQQEIWEKQRIIIQGQNLSIFYNFLMNYVLQKNIQLEIISTCNFSESQVLSPFVLYKGLEYREEYQHLSFDHKNIFDEKERKVFALKLKGYWYVQNIKNLHQKMKEINKFEPEEGSQKGKSKKNKKVKQAQQLSLHKIEYHICKGSLNVLRSLEEKDHVEADIKSITTSLQKMKRISDK